MKNNRLGILLIVSSLLIIALVVGLLLQRQQRVHAAQIRVQGVAATRSLTALSLSALAPANGERSVLQSLLMNYENPDFGYVAVTTPAGAILAEVTSPGTLVPGGALPAGTASLFGERALLSPHDDRRIREFYGPVMEGGNPKAFVRVGYFEPERMIAVKDLPFFALLALAMFLLVPLVYFGIKRELAPLGSIARQLQAMRQDAAAPAAPASIDVRVLAETLHRYLDDATRRIRELEQDGVKSLANGRLLEYSGNKMNAVLQCLPDGLLIMDPAGEITFASGKIEPLLGVDLQQVLSTGIEAWCHDPALLALCARYRHDSAEAGRQVSIDFAPLQVPHKRVCATAQPLVGGAGMMAFGTLIVLRDVTREHLGQQAGNDFVAHVSHELKSPLNVLAMYSEILQGASADDDALRIEAINVIRDETERMNALVNNLLNVSKLDMGSLAPERSRVKLDDLLRDAFNQAMPRAEAKSMTMEITVPRDMAAVSIDKDLFRIALNNLLNNAIKYSENGGRVALIAEEGENSVVITVTDSGIGIAPEDQLHVFEKFYRVREGDVNPRGGHGLGLYLASQIVELHHGRMTLASTLGTGSQFAIHLKKMPALMQGENVL
jgi:two-component system sensor histidine kinase VicK